MSPADPAMPSPETGDRLEELFVRDLGIIDEARLVLGEGMTAITGETGAGKTLIVGAIELLLGGRADPSLVRSGCDEAVVEGRFTLAGEEMILSRVIPAEGRSRSYLNGRLATAASLGEVGELLVDLHGQHAQQSLLRPAVQRAALDDHAGTDLEPLRAIRSERAELERSREVLGGEPGARAREMDLLRFQVGELDAAQLDDPDEDQRLDREESVLADAAEHRLAAERGAEVLSSDGGALDGVGAAIAALDGRAPFTDVVSRLRGVHAELGDLAAAVRDAAETIEEDPARLAALRDRRQQLVDLRRKYANAPSPVDGVAGDGTLAAVMAFFSEARRRLDDLEGHDRRAAELDQALAAAREAEARAAASVGTTRRAGAPALAQAVEDHLGSLAMGGARFSVTVGAADPGDDVTFELAANRGAASGPLRKVASGGELARTMLALRLVLRAAPPVLVFDEVDAGVGGEAALAVGRALGALGRDRQVLVVTHLPQVAAFADAQVTIRKETIGAVTIASARSIEDGDRLVELSRMLSGTPESARVQDAAQELLTMAATERDR